MFGDEVNNILTYKLVGSRNPLEDDDVLDADTAHTELNVAACTSDG